jgi:hypothetical protein
MRLALVVLSALSVFAQPVPLTLAEKEAFLKTAKVVTSKDAAGGITGSLRATLSDGKITHDAHIQTIDESKARFEGSRGTEINFRDTYKFNIAAYRLAKLLHLNMIPPSIPRDYQGKSAAFTWWVDNVMFDEGGRLKKKANDPDTERWSQQIHTVRLFDQLISNTDRNLGNLLITKSWEVWMIDHTRAFRTAPDLMNAKLVVQCDRELLDALKALDAPALRSATLPYLTSFEISALLKRRDKIVKIIEAAGPKGTFEMPVRQ